MPAARTIRKRTALPRAQARSQNRGTTAGATIVSSGARRDQNRDGIAAGAGVVLAHESIPGLFGGEVQIFGLPLRDDDPG